MAKIHKWEKLIMKIMKFFFLFSYILMSSHVNANEPDGADGNFQQAIENGILCEDTAPWVDERGDKRGDKMKFFKKMLAKAGFKIMTLKKSKWRSMGMEGYEIFLVRKNGFVEVLGHELLAVYAEPESEHFLALLNVDKESIINEAKQKIFALGYSLETLNYKYDTKYDKGVHLIFHHTGKHMDGNGWNSNRTILSLRRKGEAWVTHYGMPYGVEIESCEDTHSEWFANICKKFTQRPLTWVGCAFIDSEHLQLKGPPPFDYSKWPKLENGK
jgi:hypothetical protein